MIHLSSQSDHPSGETVEQLRKKFEVMIRSENQWHMELVDQLIAACAAAKEQETELSRLQAIQALHRGRIPELLLQVSEQKQRAEAAEARHAALEQEIQQLKEQLNGAAPPRRGE